MYWWGHFADVKYLSFSYYSKTFKTFNCGLLFCNDYRNNLSLPKTKLTHLRKRLLKQYFSECGCVYLDCYYMVTLSRLREIVVKYNI